MGYEQSLPEELQELQKMVRDFAIKRIEPVCREAEKTAEVPWDLVREGQKMGLNTLHMPKEYGGGGLSSFEFAVIREEIARGDIGFATLMGGGGIHSVLAGGSEEQKRMACDVLLSGGFLAFALTEPNAGSDSAALITTAKRVGDEYVLNGSKCFCSSGSISEYVTVFASTDLSKGGKGVTAFWVPTNTPGFVIGSLEHKMGQRVCPVATLHFDDMVIPASARMGEEGEGFKIAMKSLTHSRPVNGSSAVGLAQSAYEKAVKYAHERVLFGQPIANFQGVGFMLADMAIQIQAARQLVWLACRLTDMHAPDRVVSSSAKCFASDTAVRVTTDAVQIFGGNGYSQEYPVEKLMRDAKLCQIYEGSNQVQRKIITEQITRQYNKQFVSK